MSGTPIYRSGGDVIGYVEYDTITDKYGEEIGKLSHGSIYTSGYSSRKIGSYDRNYWYDSSKRPVVEYKVGLLLGSSYSFLKTSEAGKFRDELFR